MAPRFLDARAANAKPSALRNRGLFWVEVYRGRGAAVGVDAWIQCPMVLLVPMSFGEKVRQFELSRRSHAGERAATDGIDVDEADRQVDDLIERLLPRGFETPGHNFMWIVDGDQKERVGWTWVGPEVDDPAAYYIWDIEIAESVRGAGLGGKALDQIEMLARKAGANRLGLHVFETNTGARRLYESKGFVLSNQEQGHIDMSKDLEGA